MDRSKVTLDFAVLIVGIYFLIKYWVALYALSQLVDKMFGQ